MKHCIKKILSVLMSVVFLMLMFSLLIPTKVRAVTLQKPLVLGIQEYRTNSEPVNMAYGIGNPDNNGSTTDSIVGAKIWDIVEYNSMADTQYDNTKNYYCVKAGVGFRDTGDKAIYDVSYDLKKDRDEILQANNKYLTSLVTMDNDAYYNILGLADLMYIPGVSSEEEKDKLIQDAGILQEEYPVEIKDSDLEAIQQAALWYFTNYDDVLFDKIYNQYGKTGDNATWFTFKIKDSGYTYRSLRDYQNPDQVQEGEQRENQAIAIYNHLIEEAIKRGQEYKAGTAESLTKITLYANSSVEETQPVITIDREEPEGEYNIQLIKVDSKNENTKLEGARFKVTLADGSSKEYTTDSQGMISIPSIDITETGTDTIKIEETQAPEGYNKLIGEIQVRITKSLEGIRYVPTDVAIVDPGSAGGSKVTLDKGTNTIKVTIPDEKITGNYIIKLVKTDGESAKLEGAKFKVTLADGSSTEYITNGSGEISIPAVNITATGTDTITIEEIEAPSGYNKVIDTLTLVLTKGQEGSKYVITNAQITGEQEGVTAVVDSSKTLITVTIPNEKLEGGYAVKLVKVDEESAKLEGAKFKVTLPDGSSTEYTTNASGEISIPRIDITETGTDTITIEETQAPAGYEKIIDTITLEVTKGQDVGSYVVTNVQITDGQVEGVNVELDSSKTLITVTVPNKKLTGGYKLQLIKSDGDKALLQGAKFKITLPDGTEQESTTNENGEILIPSIEITEVGTDTIKIEELEAPAGYNKIIDVLELQITKEVESGKYVVTKAEIVGGTEQGVTVDLNKDKAKITVTVPNEKITGEYQLQLIKVDSSDSNKVLQGAKFKVTLADGTSNEYTTNEQGIISIPNVVITQTGTDTITIEEIEAPENYFTMIGTLKVLVTKEVQDGKYVATKAEFTQDTQANGSTVVIQDGIIKVTVPNRPKQFDLKLIKRIVDVNGQTVQERLESVDVTDLANGTSTTADYNMNKEPVAVKNGDIVKYTIRVYNEGEIDGYASEISEDVPEGLEFLWSEKDGAELDNDTSLSDEEKEAIKYNQGIWTIKEFDAETNRIEMISTDYLAKGKGEELVTDGANLIKAFDSEKGYVDTETEKNPDYKEVSVYMKVIAENQTGLVIRNEAAITGDTDSEGNPVDDRDSKPEDWVKYEDDEDYDNVELKVFDLALRKFIIAVSPDVTICDDEYLKNEDGTYLRAPVVDASLLNTFDDEGNVITTATYNHTKEPLEVNKNDYIIYMLRVYNEGEIPGYATEITDYLPAGLEFVEGDFNTQYGWEVSEDGRKVTTRYLENQLINDVEVVDSKNVLSYKEVPIMCKLSDTVEYNQNQTNIAEISESKDEDKKDIVDRDSDEDNVNVPSDEELPGYKDDETGEYIPGQQDDDDFEKVFVKPFDLALRKFITGLNDGEITNRVPQPTYDEETNKITYNHTKDPVEVVNGDTVIYTIRVYNEGEKAGYAEEVADDIPEYLEFLPDNEVNQTYRWKMYDSEGNETDDASKAVKIITDYLSKAHGEEMANRGRVPIDH